MEGQSSLRAKVLQQLKGDIQLAQSVYDSPEATIQGEAPGSFNNSWIDLDLWNKKEISFDGDCTVSFKFILPSLKSVECALCIPDNYPKEEFTLVGGLTDEGDVKTYDASDLKGVFAKIVDGYCLPPPPPPTQSIKVLIWYLMHTYNQWKSTGPLNKSWNDHRVGSGKVKARCVRVRRATRRMEAMMTVSE